MKTAKDILGFDDRWFVLTGIPVVAFLTGAMMFANILVEQPLVFFRICFPVGLAYTTVYWLIFRQLCVFFRNKFPAPEELGRRLSWLIVFVIIIYFLVKWILDPILHRPVHEVLGDPAGHEVSMMISSLLVTFLVLGIYETVGFYHQLEISKLEKERLIKENVQSQLESLKSQVNPHFLFNSLNTLAYLIPENAVKAENFVQKLSKAYRYILDIRDKELATLEEELAFLDSYACLLKERFGESLHIQITVPQVLMQRKIVPLALQMLFENAIKHNVVSTQHPLTIEVRAEGDKLVVSNNLQHKSQPEDGAKVGLENIRNRYRLLSGQEVEVKPTLQSFEVTLPLL